MSFKRSFAKFGPWCKGMLINWWAMYACLAKFLNLDSVLNVNMVVAAFNQEKALVEAFSVITNLWMELFEALEQTRGGVWEN